MGKTALVVGATGAVGREIVRGLCEDENYDKIIVWARRELNFSHEKLETQIIDFDEIKDMPPREIDEIFCALGTTMKQAGSREAFLRVDVDYVYAAAVFKLLPACVFGKFRPLSGASIARAMINAARSDAHGVQIYEPREFL